MKISGTGNAGGRVSERFPWSAPEIGNEGVRISNVLAFHFLRLVLRLGKGIGFDRISFDEPPLPGFAVGLRPILAKCLTELGSVEIRRIFRTADGGLLSE